MEGQICQHFSLLPLEQFNLYREKPEKLDSKEEDEEKQRYRLIPHAFSNWWQAFAILASVIGEKAPEYCYGLFCNMDSIGEAHRVCGDIAWLRYDEQSLPGVAKDSSSGGSSTGPRKSSSMRGSVDLPLNAGISMNALVVGERTVWRSVSEGVK